ncbi:uncharacterized protein GGS22DRAFT_184315 [Annulohypoxylon maeteangense]|uniref:uncharacterized protein n=1 Tax=Annulohypoxylon maeteangense TaxID=1927788 RepID=UPI0020083040|nr:uncharacterized protein GGS22DRAFT_184315 [Annulohypoxylon maeteangense]KAI0888736.1 hypothetical protein GGS22DRAFT_184315 [Annulohypoxylon maeteangense]
MPAIEETGGDLSSLSNDVLLIYFPYLDSTGFVERVTKRFKGLEVRWIKSNASPLVPPRAEDLDAKDWDGVTLLATFMPPPAEFLSKVRYVQLTTAGIDRWPVHSTYQDEKVTFATSNGVHATQIAEWVIGAWLMHQHAFLNYAANMKTGTWQSPFTAKVQDSTGMRIGILGYGAIGRQCARLAKTLSMEVYAYTRSERATSESRKDDSYCIPGTGDPDGLLPTKWFHGSAKGDVDSFLAQDLDLLVISLPLTSETRHILSHEQFEILSKKKTFVANIARGGHINQDALIKALETDQIRGAALDVTDPEPLPSDHPLWKAPNLIITPHISWKTDALYGRLLDLLELNLERLASGQQPINVVNRQLHY